MTANEFFNEWSTKYANLELTVREVTSSFEINKQTATAWLQGFVTEGKATARYYTGSRVTVYTLVKGN